MSREIKVNEEQAKLEFSAFADEMDLDLDLNSMEEEDKKEFLKIQDKIIKAIMYGDLTFNDRFEPVYTPKRSGEVSSLTFREPTGAMLKSMDMHKRDHQMSKMFGLMAEMTGTDAKTFAKLSATDFKVCSAIVTVFLG